MVTLQYAFKLFYGEYKLVRVIEGAALRSELTWDAFASLLRLFVSQASEWEFALREWMWINCRWLNLFATSHLRIRPDCGLGLIPETGCGQFSSKDTISVTLFGATGGSAPEICEIGGIWCFVRMLVRQYMLFGDFGKQSSVRADLFDLLVTKHDLARKSWFFLTALSRVKWNYFRGGNL